MSIMAKTPSGYKKIGSAYLGEQPVDKVFNANGDVVYALQRDLTGVPPLLFKGKERSELLNYRICGNTETKQRDYSRSSPLTVPVYDGELYNYRIYGNTANGESVGDRTGNLFDGEIMIGGLSDSTGSEVDGLFTRLRTSWIKVEPSETYSFNLNNLDYKIRNVYVYDESKSLVYTSEISSNSATVAVSSLASYIRFVFRKNDGSETVSISDCQDKFMLNSGSTALPYEPYGYKVPITVTNSGTTSNETIYLPEPIKMVGGEAEYVDFYSQKQYFADGTNTAVTIPALPISAGTNTITVNTTAQPSSVEVNIDENVSVGDLVTSGQHAGEYAVPVTVEGKNLFDLNTWANTIRSISGDGVMSISGSTVSITSINAADCYTEPYANSQTGVYKMSVKPNTNYTVNWYGSNYRIMIFENGIFDYTYNFFSDTPQSFTTHSDTTFLTIRFGVNPTNPLGTTATISEFIISEGSEPIPYEPYHAPVTTPIYLPEPIKMVGEEAEYVDYKEQKQHRVRKNLLQNTATSQTINGVTFTVNSDGSVTCNGTATQTAVYILNNTFSLEPGTYNLTGCPAGGGYVDKYKMDVVVSPIAYGTDKGDGSSFTLSSALTNALYRIIIYAGQTCNNLTFYPMIRKADIEDDTYEPYIENVDLDVTLPALPTIKGTNTMSIDTEVQPSRMDIEGRIKSLT